MKTLFSAFIILSATVAGYAFSPNASLGENESRNLEKFSGIVSMGNFDVNIIFDKSSKVVVTANAVEIPEIETVVKDGILTIKRKKDSEVDLGKVKVDVYTASLGSVVIKGSGSVNCPVAVPSADLSIKIQGSGSMDMAIDADKFDAVIEGSGNMDLRGKSMNSEFDIQGSGNINAKELTCSNAEISIAGSGNCKVNVSGNLTAVVKGSGNVLYTGGAKVKATSHGSGKIKSM